MFTHTAVGRLVKYLKLEKSLGLDIVEQSKQKIAISNNNSYLEIANKVINNPFPMFLEIGPDIEGLFLEPSLTHTFPKINFSTRNINNHFYLPKLDILLSEALSFEMIKTIHLENPSIKFPFFPKTLNKALDMYRPLLHY